MQDQIVPVFEAEALSQRFGKTQALDGLTLLVEQPIRQLSHRLRNVYFPESIT